MRNRVLSLVLLALSSLSAHAGQLEIPGDFEFLAVDGKEIGGLFGAGQSIDLTPGRHKIALKYSGVVEDEANPRLEEFIYSEPLLLTLDVEGHHQYTLVPHPSMKSDPRTYSQNPKIKIVRDDRAQTNFEVALLVERRQTKLERVTQNFDSTDRSKPASEMERLTRADSPVAVAPINPQPATNSAQTPAAGMLNYWWNQADQATREAFLKRVLR